MTGMTLLVCCGWIVLLCLSVQAYGKVDIYISMNYKLNTINLRGGGGNSPALDRLVTSIENPSDYCVVFVNVYYLMFYREPRLTQARVAETSRVVWLWWSRECRGRTVLRSGYVERTVCDVKRESNSRVAGGSWRCTEHTPNRYTICDRQQSVGYCMFLSVQLHNLLM